MRITLSLVLILAVFASAAQAECYADYKARQDRPFALHYGVARIERACTPRQAARELAPRLAAAGWRLLTVVSVFGAEGLEERRENAGAHFLRY
ncbi:MAG: hypothetical protein ACLFTP_09575 [Rhodosalinus sp.]|uniref:hypothetical protein n=1 Tax=Rhodosalinus sp. TaxID=2047741 RepID=UPI00397B01DB